MYIIQIFTLCIQYYTFSLFLICNIICIIINNLQINFSLFIIKKSLPFRCDALACLDKYCANNIKSQTICFIGIINFVFQLGRILLKPFQLFEVKVFAIYFSIKYSLHNTQLQLQVQSGSVGKNTLLLNSTCLRINQTSFKINHDF